MPQSNEAGVTDFAAQQQTTTASSRTDIIYTYSTHTVRGRKASTEWHTDISIILCLVLLKRSEDAYNFAKILPSDMNKFMNYLYSENDSSVS